MKLPYNADRQLNLASNSRRDQFDKRQFFGWLQAKPKGGDLGTISLPESHQKIKTPGTRRIPVSATIHRN